MAASARRAKWHYSRNDFTKQGIASSRARTTRCVITAPSSRLCAFSVLFHHCLNQTHLLVKQGTVSNKADDAAYFTSWWFLDILRKSNYVLEQTMYIGDPIRLRIYGPLKSYRTDVSMLLTIHIPLSRFGLCFVSSAGSWYIFKNIALPFHLVHKLYQCPHVVWHK